MAGTKGKSGRKPNLSDVDNAHLDRRDRAERAQENNTGFDKISSPPERLNEFAKSLWLSVVQELESKNLLTKLDEPLLEEYVTQVDLSRQADRAIKEYGVIYVNEKDEIKKNPAVDVKNNAAKNIKAIGSSLGLDPISRAAILSGVEPEDDSEMDDLMGRFGGK